MDDSLAKATYTCMGPVTLATVQAQVFNGCGGTNGGLTCHSGPQAAAGMDLSDGSAYDHLLHVRSASAPSRFLVEPNDPDNSFLWRKLVNELSTTTSEGLPMPRDINDAWAPLTHDHLTTVRCWIASGAGR